MATAPRPWVIRTGFFISESAFYNSHPSATIGKKMPKRDRGSYSRHRSVQTEADPEPETGVYHAEDIIACKYDANGVPLWRVRWQGYGEEDDTWEPYDHLANLGVDFLNEMELLRSDFIRRRRAVARSTTRNFGPQQPRGPQKKSRIVENLSSDSSTSSVADVESGDASDSSSSSSSKSSSSASTIQLPVSKKARLMSVQPSVARSELRVHRGSNEPSISPSTKTAEDVWKKSVSHTHDSLSSASEESWRVLRLINRPKGNLSVLVERKGGLLDGDTRRVTVEEASALCMQSFLDYLLSRTRIRLP